ncbi:MAG: hypothetical protein A3C30_01905 [Candidatus Levybacteria bacterium RIFCSPHIGHO2_02_FULL_40_18]|nr:MAG: hypothetical protein A3C30_01905 [Candidatus Levybacteria bacterium RIFCSPHIGHO2_02_FULL_40_18]OGH31680.1 MAG: hypothetical protein A3E43_01625 [Candidatus Levybacteria bacterium RIFCSPHIGHO2_12_FULL_40_31]OGH40580.1 MAG: hypothetical protein A2894_00175 [Candidatus Levybacteria bacterium RIFCSPLOWO2_01_FULL_40_64]OGH48755.1 MAG: hypothetical protein A3I54_03800 [Candidatus Levybacteria bacterium RIFCSPLOWO2_02_FULL_41_11]OGH53299.1 MAG: hypothetical protein A3G15_04740 [Candidatus Levy
MIHKFMKLIVAHSAPDLDAIASSWIIKRFLPGWENAECQFAPAGEKLKGVYLRKGEVIEKVDDHDVIHVDTGLGPLDHHQTEDENTCATKLAFDYVLASNESLSGDENKIEALKRIVEYAVNEDHFQEVFLPDPDNEIYGFSIVSLVHGIKLMYPKDDQSVMAFGMDTLDSFYHYFENKVWAEKEIKEKGIRFDTKWGKGLAVETLNDTVLKLAQVMGYVIAVRKDPSTGSVRIKARPKRRANSQKPTAKSQVLEDVDIDLTPVYEKLRKMDPDATWFLHVSKRMLLNGSPKNPKMKGSKLTLSEVVEVLQNI